MLKNILGCNEVSRLCSCPHFQVSWLTGSAVCPQYLWLSYSTLYHQHIEIPEQTWWQMIWKIIILYKLRVRVLKYCLGVGRACWREGGFQGFLLKQLIESKARPRVLLLRTREVLHTHRFTVVIANVFDVLCWFINLPKLLWLLV